MYYFLVQFPVDPPLLSFFCVSEVRKSKNEKNWRTRRHSRRGKFQTVQGYFAKHQDEKDKAQVISTAIGKCYVFDYAEVPLYPTLAKIIVNRYWTASDIVKMAALVNAARFLSPFLVVDLTEEDVALIQQEHKNLINASLVSTSEVKATRTKLIASTTKYSEGFMIMLNGFVNLLFALFSSS